MLLPIYGGALRRFPFEVLLVVVSILLGVTIVESYCRLVYTEPWYQSLLGESEEVSPNASVKLNTFGLRDKDFSDVVPHDCKRVLILGDSFTFGQGVKEEEAIFPRLLEKQLNSLLSPKGLSVEILNGGLPGSLTNNWLDLLNRVIVPFKPDIVLIVFFLRDGTRLGSMGHFFDPIRREIQGRSIANRTNESILYRHSYLYRLFQDFLDRSFLARKYSELLNESYFGGTDKTEEWERAKVNIRKIKAVSESHGAVIGMVIFPVLVELNESYPFQGIVNHLVKFGKEGQIPTHNLLPSFLGMHAPDLWVSSLDQHPNALGHDIAATSILPFLNQFLENQKD